MQETAEKFGLEYLYDDSTSNRSLFYISKWYLGMEAVKVGDPVGTASLYSQSLIVDVLVTSEGLEYEM